jgi:hypothetical protein
MNEQSMTLLQKTYTSEDELEDLQIRKMKNQEDRKRHKKRREDMKQKYDLNKSVIHEI